MVHRTLFSRNRCTSDGLQCYCKSCKSKANRRRNKASRTLAKMVETTAKQKLPPVEFTIDDIYEAYKTKTHCDLTGLPFSWELSERGVAEDAPSADRIDPAKGYTKDNVRWVCWWVNRALGTMTDDEFFARIRDMLVAYGRACR